MTASLTFAARLKALRLQAGLSQQQLGQLSGLGQNTLSRYETGERLPTWLAVQALARALGVSTEDLRDG